VLTRRPKSGKSDPRPMAGWCASSAEVRGDKPHGRYAFTNAVRRSSSHSRSSRRSPSRRLTSGHPTVRLRAALVMKLMVKAAGRAHRVIGARPAC